MTRSNLKLRLIFLIKIFLIYIFIFIKSYAEESKALDSFVVMGSDNAAVKIKVFSSLTCPHCANFHINVISKIREKYIESGKVQLIFIDFPLDQAAFNASKLLYCLDKKKQIAFLDNIYEKQSEWTKGSNLDEINNNLKEMTKKLGIDSNQFDKCITNEEIGDKILNGRIAGNKKYSIDSTPTIIINEKKFNGPTSLENINKKIEKLI